MSRIAVGSDHAGFHLKQVLSDHLTTAGHEVIDLGCHSTERCDYPDFGAAVGRAVVDGTADLGVCTCGSGIGIAIAANKIPGVRAGTVHDATSARLAHEHNDANVICMGERLIGEQVALDSLDAFLAAVFEGGRHAARVDKIDRLLPRSIPSTAMSHVVVLGAGFVGTAVARSLSERSSSYSILDQSIDPTFVRRDADTGRAIRDEIERTGATALVNTIGLLRGTEEEMTEANVVWPTWLAHEILPGTGARFVHFGSASEYGDPGSAEPIPESAPANPSGLYGETKWAGSSAVLDAIRGGFDAVVVRAFNLVGPKLPPASPLFQFLTDLAALPPEGGTMELWWPDTIRDFILLDDVGRAVCELTSLETVPDIVNLCSQVGVSFADIVLAMASAMGKQVTITSLDRPGVPAVVGDCTRLRELTGIVPEMSAKILAERCSL